MDVIDGLITVIAPIDDSPLRAGILAKTLLLTLTTNLCEILSKPLKSYAVLSDQLSLLEFSGRSKASLRK